MKIAFGFEIFYPERNGIITATINLGRNLVELGHEVYFIVPAHKSLPETIENGIHIVQIKGRKSIIYRGMEVFKVHNKVVLDLFKNEKIDIAHTLTPWLMGRALNWAAQKCNVPVVSTHHTLIDRPEYISYLVKNKHFQKLMSKEAWPVVLGPCYKKTWVVTAPAHGTLQEIIDHFPKIDARYISNGIDLRRFKKEASCPVPEIITPEWIGKKTLIFVGRVGLEKGLPNTVKAFKEALKEVPDARLVIIGSGPYEKDLAKLVENLGIKDNVLLTGMIKNEDIINSRVLSDMCAFVTASVSENQSMTVIEALCCKLPVICANVPNMSDLVSNENGWLFEPENNADMTRCMVEALTKPEERDQKAIKAGESVEQYDGLHVAQEFEKLYKELLEKKAQGFTVKNVKLK